MPLPIKSKAKRSQPESTLQKACVRWFDMQYPNLTLFAIPNGGKRGVITASIMKAEGVRRGVCDLFLMEPAGPFHGMFIEMKTPTGKLSAEQKAFMMKAGIKCYKVVIARNVDEFIKSVNDYLKGKG